MEEEQARQIGGRKPEKRQMRRKRTSDMISTMPADRRGKDETKEEAKAKTTNSIAIVAKEGTIMRGTVPRHRVLHRRTNAIAVEAMVMLPMYAQCNIPISRGKAKERTARVSEKERAKEVEKEKACTASTK